jgi:hypothetical protein
LEDAPLDARVLVDLVDYEPDVHATLAPISGAV